MKVLPVLCLLLVSLVTLGIITQNQDQYDCDTLKKIFENDFEGSQRSDESLYQAYQDCLTVK